VRRSASDYESVFSARRQPSLPSSWFARVTVVIIPSGEKGDRLVGSLEVRVPVVGRTRVSSCTGASNLTGRSKSEPGSPEKSALREADCRIVGRAEPLIT
jgi:hypothetical protein